MVWIMFVVHDHIASFHFQPLPPSCQKQKNGTDKLLDAFSQMEIGPSCLCGELI